MTQNSFALPHSAEELRDDRERVLEAVMEHGVALQNAAEKMRGDRELVWQAVRQKRSSLSPFCSTAGPWSSWPRSCAATAS